MVGLCDNRDNEIIVSCFTNKMIIFLLLITTVHVQYTVYTTTSEEANWSVCEECRFLPLEKAKVVYLLSKNIDTVFFINLTRFNFFVLSYRHTESHIIIEIISFIWLNLSRYRLYHYRTGLIYGSNGYIQKLLNILTWLASSFLPSICCCFRVSICLSFYIIINEY